MATGRWPKKILKTHRDRFRSFCISFRLFSTIFALSRSFSTFLGWLFVTVFGHRFSLFSAPFACCHLDSPDIIDYPYSLALLPAPICHLALQSECSPISRYDTRRSRARFSVFNRSTKFCSAAFSRYRESMTFLLPLPSSFHQQHQYSNVHTLPRL